MLIALGAFSILVAAALTGFGLAGIDRQLDARTEVVRLGQALINHNNADAFMDDVRSDVMRAMLNTVGTNKEGEDAIRAEFQHHVEVVETSLAENLALPLPPRLRNEYVQLARMAEAFAPGGLVALNLALSDLAAASANFETFRREFSELETAMDNVRDITQAEVERVRLAAARTGHHAKWMIIASSGVGVLLLGAMTVIAVRIAARITTALAESREQERHLALHDSLTGLANRILLTDRLAQALAQVGHENTTVAVLCIDLDRFKQVNDTLGHPVGDALLQDVADRLRGCLRRSDTVARLGGDEFVIVQTPLSGAAEATALAQRLVHVLSEPYDLAGHSVVVGASVGVALAAADSLDIARLLKMADTALYRAKADGRGTYRLFEPEMDQKLRTRQLLEAELRQAVELQQFELHYQPLIDLASGRVNAVEALIRWRHPEKGLLSPDAFIPVAEEAGLIGPIGNWVLNQACADSAQWPADLRIAVNVSGHQFKIPGLIDTVLTSLRSSSVAADRLELEITETALLGDAEATLAILRELRAYGIRIALDDFGTGYSALNYLHSFPFDKLKIDRCFIKDVEVSAKCKSIVGAIIGLSKSLQIAVTAEGVETSQQLEFLQEAGCDQVQGYLFSRPVSRPDIDDMLGRHLLTRPETDCVLPAQDELERDGVELVHV